MTSSIRSSAGVGVGGLILARLRARGAGIARRDALDEPARRHVVGHDRTRTGLGSVAELDRRDQRRVDARVHAVADLGPVLVDAVVVRGDRARAEVRVGADLGVADVGEVRHLRALADLGVLHLDDTCPTLAPAARRVPGRR